MKKRKFKGYGSLKEARAKARELAETRKWLYTPVPIFIESDGSFSVEKPCDRKAQFHVAIDKSGAKYAKKWVRQFNGRKIVEYIKVE